MSKPPERNINSSSGYCTTSVTARNRSPVLVYAIIPPSYFKHSCIPFRVAIIILQDFVPYLKALEYYVRCHHCFAGKQVNKLSNYPATIITSIFLWKVTPRFLVISFKGVPLVAQRPEEVWVLGLQKVSWEKNWTT